MSVPQKKMIFDIINRTLVPFNLKFSRTKNNFQEYIPFDETLAGARESGLSVGDYIDQKFNVPGSTQDTINHLASLGVFDRKISTVCEIGPGSGRYVEKVKEICNPEYYEVYETAERWRDWLVKQYLVVAQPCDGKTLGETQSKSIDLVHTHKVLNGLGILTICGYLNEMIRVVKDDGVISFLIS
jgi:hypothetical protein